MTTTDFGSAPPPPATAIQLDADHYIIFVEYQGELAGIDEWHRKPGAGWCRGWIAFEATAWSRGFVDIATWKVEQRDPLTLTPSIACRACGSHGFIESGKWRNA